MNTMEALGTGLALSPKDSAPGLNLGADSETLALFASLFAMMQAPQADAPETGTADVDPQTLPHTKETLLPAAAMLMAGLSPAPEMVDPGAMTGQMPSGEAGSDGEAAGDAAGLLKLLLASQDIAAPDQLSAGLTSQKESDGEAVVPVRTATEMLTGAIEILKALEADPSSDAPVAADDVLPDAPRILVMVPPSSEFIGPMPAVAPSTSLPAPAVTLSAAPEFIGPMPAVTQVVTQTAAVAPAPAAMVAPPSSEFVGPMPAITAAAAAPVHVPNADPRVGSGHNHAVLLDKAVTSDPSQPGVEEDGAAGDDGFVHRRTEFMASPRARQDLAAGQQKAAELSAMRQRVMSAATDTSQGTASPASTSTSAQMLAQQVATSQGAGSTLAASGADGAQSALAGTTGGQAGAHSGGQQGGQAGGQQSAAQQMADGGQARGPADRTLLHRLNTDSAGWSQTMVKRLTADLRAGVQNVRIILEPQKLGRLNVELGLRNGKASIRIAAETNEAARLLSGARGQLGQMLESAGMRLASFQTSGAQADAGLDGGQGSQGRGGEGAGDQADRNNAGRKQEFSNKIGTALDDTADDTVTGDDALRDGETAVLSILA